MSNVVPFDQTSALPAHLQALGTQSLNSDLSSGVGTGYPVVSFKGKVWHVQQGDDRTLLQNEHGDPLPAIEVIILKANPNLSKLYYPGGYTEGSTEKPTCYSNDGVAPAADSKEIQSTKCAICPHNQWGSRISEQGAKGKACSDSRRLAIAPSNDIEHPMLIRIPAATLRDLTNYADMLNRRRAPYTAVVTRIGFDHSVAYPKLVFRATRWVTEDEARLIADVTERDVVRNIVGSTTVATEAAGIDELPPTPSHVTTKPAPAQPSLAAKFAVQEDEVAQVVKAAPTPAPAPEPAPMQPSTSNVATVISKADQSLEDALRMLDADD